MIKNLLFALIATAVFAMQLSAQEATPAPKGKFSGLMFGDYFYNITMKDTSKKDLNGFQFRRIYFTYDYAISADFDTRFRIEADQAALTSNGKIGFLAKDAYLKWKNIFQNSDLIFGLSPTPAFDISEGAWGYRYLEKTIMDLRGIVPARDLGVDLRGKLTDNGSVNYWLKVGNNSGNTPESDKFKRYYGLVHLKPTAEFQATLYGDYDAEAQKLDPALAQYVGNSRLTVAAFANYAVVNSYSLGVEGFLRSTQNGYLASAGTPLSNVSTIGVTGFASAAIDSAHRVVGRVDYYEPNTSVDLHRNLLIILGLEFIPAPDVRVTPNIEYSKDQGDVAADFQARMTFFYNFH